MEFDFTEEEIAFRQSIRHFVDNEIAPVADEIDKKEEFPLEWFRKIGQLGYFGLRYPEKYGGSDAGFMMYIIFVEELARGSLSVAASVAMQCLMATDFIYRFGTEEQKQKFLVPAIRGEKIGAFCLSEPNAGSDLARVETTVTDKGDCFVLNGQKMWVTSGTVADFYTVLATSDKKLGLNGLNFYLVERGTPGLVIGKKIPKMGLRASETTELSLDNCAIPKDHQLGERGVENLMKILVEIRTMTGALALGVAKAALEDSVRYSKERICFNQPIAKFQAIQHKIADVATELYAAELMVYHTARLIERQKKCDCESAMTKLFASEMANRAVDIATRILAGYGFTMEYPVQRYFRDARFLLIGGGTSELLKNIIAKDVVETIN